MAGGPRVRILVPPAQSSSANFTTDDVTGPHSSVSAATKICTGMILPAQRGNWRDAAQPARLRGVTVGRCRRRPRRRTHRRDVRVPRPPRRDANSAVRSSRRGGGDLLPESRRRSAARADSANAGALAMGASAAGPRESAALSRRTPLADIRPRPSNQDIPQLQIRVIAVETRKKRVDFMVRSTSASTALKIRSRKGSSRNRESAPFGRDLGNHLKRPFDFYFGHKNVISSEPGNRKLIALALRGSSGAIFPIMLREGHTCSRTIVKLSQPCSSAGVAEHSSPL